MVYLHENFVLLVEKIHLIKGKDVKVRLHENLCQKLFSKLVVRTHYVATATYSLNFKKVFIKCIHYQMLSNVYLGVGLFIGRVVILVIPLRPRG